MASFLKKVQKGAQQVQKSANAKSAQLSSNLKESFNQAKTKANEQLNEVLNVNYDKHLGKPVILEGKMWKRRGGMGKFTHNNQTQSSWELRRFELRGTTVLYYRLPPSEEVEINFGGDSSSNLHLAESTWKGNEDDEQQQQPQQSEENLHLNVPRGYIDFKEDRALVHVSAGHSVGAPSPFCLSIITPTGVPGNIKVQWMLSFDDQSKMMQWLAAMSTVVAHCNADRYNVQLVNAANPNNPENLPFLRRPPVQEPPKEGEASGQTEICTPNVQSASHQLWIAQDDYIVVRKDQQTQIPKKEESKEPAASEGAVPSATIQEMEKQHQKELQELQNAQKIYCQVMDKKVKDMNASAVNTKQKHEQEVRELQEEIEQLQQQHQQSSTEDNDNVNVNELKNQLHELKSLQAQKEKEWNAAAATLKDQHQQEMQALKQQLEELKETYETKAAEQQKEAAASKRDEVAAIQAMLDEAVAAKANLQKELEAQANRKEELEELKTKFDQQAAEQEKVAAKKAAEAADALAKLQEATKAQADLQKELEELKASQSTASNTEEEAAPSQAKLEEVAMNAAAKASEAATAQAQEEHEKEIAELKASYQQYQTEMQARVEELMNAAVALEEKHAKEVQDLQQTIQILQSGPPDDDPTDGSDEFHDAM